LPELCDAYEVPAVLFWIQTAEELADRLTKSAGMERAVFYSGGTEALECSMKLARQYHIENHEPERVNFIGRDRSYHGNSLATLALGRHRQRRAPYEPLFASENFHKVSPAYSYRYKKEEQTEAEYVDQLAQELEDKILELGPRTVAAFYAETSELLSYLDISCQAL
jgi:adenosylmethionine-8-amino-7-oxononanoate aminotransferase